MRKLLPLAVVLLLAISACERVEEPTTTGPARSPLAVGKVFPPAQPSPALAETQPQAPPQPEQKAPAGPPPPSERDLVLLDFDVAGQNISNARTDLGTQKTDSAKAEIEAALRSVAFLETSLPSSKTLELLQRAQIEISRGQNEAGAAILQDIASLIAKVGGLSKPQETAKLAADASTALSKGNVADANKALQSLAGQIQGGEQEALLARVKDHLRGAQYAVYRDAMSVASLELDEASKYLSQLRSLTEGSWSSTEA